MDLGALFETLNITPAVVKGIAYETGITQANVAEETRMYNITCRWCVRY